MMINRHIVFWITLLSSTIYCQQIATTTSNTMTTSSQQTNKPTGIKNKKFVDRFHI